MTMETQPVAEDVPVATPVRAKARNWRKWLRRLGWLAAILVAWPLVLTLVYAFVPPPVSNVMLFRALSGNGIDKSWVSLDQMSPWLVKAVVTSEDARFCEHHGVDWIEFQGARIWIPNEMQNDLIPVQGGVASWKRTTDSPTGLTCFLKIARFPVIRMPWKIVILTIS